MKKKHNESIYRLHEANRKGLKAYFNMLSSTLDWHASVLKYVTDAGFMPPAYAEMARKLAASAEMGDRLSKTYAKPGFKIKGVTEEIVADKDFCSLLHFKRDTKRKDPKVLIVAPMSGHHATLLRDTVEALLPNHDVYITDWKDARTVPASKGEFGFEDYMSYVQDFIKKLGANTHVIAVCQPTVPVLAAVAVMAGDKSGVQPTSLTLIGGPVDTRAAKTAVTEFADSKSIDWFSDNLIARVPAGYKGAGRAVYPGFLQLAGFMSMNPDKHVQSHMDLFEHLCRGNGEKADKIKAFYDEYLAVCDLPAKFYLETIEKVFKNQDLAKGTLTYKGKKVDPGKITKTALLTVEGALDDIAAPGQTVAAHKMCTGLKPDQKFNHLQEGVGHYGTFSGKRWREDICPKITGFIRESAAQKGLVHDAAQKTAKPKRHTIEKLSTVSKPPKPRF